jgi:hypothetical protein
MPYVPKIPRNAYAFNSKLIHDGSKMSKSQSCLCFVFVNKYAVGYPTSSEKNVIRNAYQNDDNVIDKYVEEKNV